ncbi:hypothetical protein WJX72_003382 [[Myrmecia] bisecta]|uniref:3-hydroxyisobutyrate dehydrogenase n=1 Tax=[Myrmecia] bisecta TaxID=41462 RepID=A0AAW1R660_9CHLO
MLASLRHAVPFSWAAARRFCAAAAPAKDEFGKIGFIGLGNMGFKMASNLIQGGHSLVVYDQSMEALHNIGQLGAEVAASPADLAATEGVQMVVTMLPSSQNVLDVYCGSQGLLKAEGGLQPSLLIDSSTIDPPTAQRVAQEASKASLRKGVRTASLPGLPIGSPTMIDAPVSGGVTGARAATLTFMCGGEKAAVRAAEPLLKLMGKTVLYCGPPGSGQAAKVCNNLALAIEMAGIAEALALGAKLGLDPRLLSSIFNTSSARCWSSEAYNPCPGVMEGVPASRDYKGGFGTKLMVKDLGLAVAAAEHVDAPLPMGREARDVYQKVMDATADGATLDFGAIYRHVYGGPDAQPEAPQDKGT